MSDSPSDAPIARDSDYERHAVPRKQTSDKKREARKASHAEREYVALSSDLSELSEDGDEAPTARSGKRQGKEPFDKDAEEKSKSKSMRMLSLMMPQVPKRPGEARYAHKSVKGGQSSKTQAAGDKKVKTASANLRSKEKVLIRPQATDKQDQDEENDIDYDAIPGADPQPPPERHADPQLPAEHHQDTDDDIDYDVIPGADIQEKVPDVKGPSKRKKKSALDAGGCKSTSEKTGSKKAKGRKRKADDEAQPKKKRKLSPVLENTTDVPTGPATERPRRKAQAEATRKSREMLQSSQVDQEEAPPKRQTIDLDEAEHTLSIFDAGEPDKSFLAATRSSTPLRQGTNPIKKLKKPSKRPVDPWNRPSQQSQAEQSKDGKTDSHPVENRGKSRLKRGTGKSQHAEELSMLPLADSPFRQTEAPPIFGPSASEGLDLGFDVFETCQDHHDTALIPPAGREDDDTSLLASLSLLPSADEPSHRLVTVRSPPGDFDFDLDEKEVSAEVRAETRSKKEVSAEVRSEKSMWNSFTILDSPDGVVEPVAVERGGDAQAGTGRGHDKDRAGLTRTADAMTEVATDSIHRRPNSPAHEELPTIRAPPKLDARNVEPKVAATKGPWTVLDADGSALGLPRDEMLPSSPQQTTTKRSDWKISRDEAQGRALPTSRPTLLPEIDFSAIDSAAGSSTLVEARSASAPVKKLHVPQRALSKILEVKKTVQQSDAEGQRKKDAPMQDAGKENDSPHVPAKRRLLPRPPRIGTIAQQRRDTKMSRASAKGTVAHEGPIKARDPTLDAALQAARKSRKSASALRHDREHAVEEAQQEDGDRSRTIEQLAMELVQAIREAEEQKVKGVRVQARHDLRKLVTDMYAELSTVEDEDIEIVKAMEKLRDDTSSTRSTLLRKTREVREEVARAEAGLQSVIQKLGRRL